MNAVEVLTLPAEDSPLEWSKDVFTLAELNEKFETPQVIRIQSDDSGVHFGRCLDSTRPLLVYSKRRRTKMLAECVQWRSSKKKFVSMGPRLEIPKDYAGWFQLIGSKDKEWQQSAHTTIEGIAQTMCQYFLTCTQIVGLALGEEEAEGSSRVKLGEEIKLYPGEILKAEGIDKKTWKLYGDDYKGGITKDPETLPETRFLRCTDFHGRRIALPCAHPGLFHAVAEGNRTDCSTVYQMEDILAIHSTSELPIVVKLIFGWPPPAEMPCQFQGYFRFLSQIRPETLVMQSLVVGEKSFAEIPVNIDWKVERVLNIASLSNSQIFTSAMKVCVSKVYPYLTSIKIMSIEGKCLPLNVSDSDKRRSLGRTNSQSKLSTVGLSIPINMSDFNPLNIYPPVYLDDETQAVSESWSLTFRDPQDQTLYDNKGNVSGEEDVWEMTPEDTAAAAGLDRDTSIVRIGKKVIMRKTRKGSVANETGPGHRPMEGRSANGIGNPDRRDLRAIKERSRSQREAKC